MSKLDKIKSLTARITVVANHMAEAQKLSAEIAKNAGSSEEKECFEVLEELIADHYMFYVGFVKATKERMSERMKNEVEAKVIAYKNNVSC